MTTQNTQFAAITAFYFERYLYESETPLGAYGTEILKNLQRNYSERYWQLNFEGLLIKTVNERERELADLKFEIMQQLEAKFPRPKTDDFLEIAAHMNDIDEIAESLINAELVKPI